jgi:hypothetical protein
MCHPIGATGEYCLRKKVGRLGRRGADYSTSGLMRPDGRVKVSLLELEVLKLLIRSIVSLSNEVAADASLESGVLDFAIRPLSRKTATVTPITMVNV